MDSNFSCRTKLKRLLVKTLTFTVMICILLLKMGITLNMNLVCKSFLKKIKTSLTLIFWMLPSLFLNPLCLLQNWVKWS